MLAKTSLLWILAMMLGLAGCDPARPYLAAFREHAAAWEELTQVLQSVKDEASMAAAKANLDGKLERFQEASRRARDLPKPPPGVLQRLEGERDKMEFAVARLQQEIRRISQLPGGREFLGSFGQGKLPVGGMP